MSGRLFLPRAKVVLRNFCNQAITLIEDYKRVPARQSGQKAGVRHSLCALWRCVRWPSRKRQRASWSGWSMGKHWLRSLLRSAESKAVEAALKQFTRIPQIWITPLWLLSSGAIMALLVFVVNRRWTPSVGQERIVPPPSTGAAQIVASAALTPPTPSPIDVTAFFQQSYSGQLQTEVEGNVRAMISSRLPNEWDEFVVKLIATGLINVVYDKIWLVIFRRQVLALTELNHRVLRREQNQNLLRRGGAEVSRCVCELFI
jgi:hypothetical protein